MITYVNTVFVSNVGTVVTDPANIAKGKFIFFDIDNNSYELSENTTRFKIGMGTGKTAKQVNYSTGVATDVPVIKWSNIIKVDDIKSITPHTNAGDTEDTVTIDFTNLNANLLSKFAEGGKRIIVRLTFKDLPTRFRKWTESYEYVTAAGDTKATIAKNIGDMINREYKRARVVANVATTNKIILSAMPYDDDNSVDSINWANKGRFNVNIYYTDPAAEGWESTNKNFPLGVSITKVPGKTDTASAKLVRDREAQAMGYEGILNRGEGTWPIIKPAMETDLSATYNSVTIEFENMYRTADDLFRKTKEAVEIYTVGNASVITDELDKLNPVVEEEGEEG